MMPEDRTHKVSCSSYVNEVEIAFEILAGKWIPLIVWTLSTEGTKRFGELRKLMPSATQKMLTQQLRALEKHGIVRRKIYPEVPPIVEYSLTDIGEKLGPILKDLNAWSTEYLADRGSGTK
ncbi:winged helix-turn-helix transcriptional regulator [Desulfoluna limicola]|nr:helix-turn-helix domain-containing protein [Desulfoluna limicola]